MERAYVYIFPSPHNSYYAVNYDATNAKANMLLSLFDIWYSKGEHKLSKDGNHQEVWFELMPAVATFACFKNALKRCGVEVVDKYPF